MNTHVRSYVHDHGPKPAQAHGGLIYAQNEHHAHTASKKRAMQEGPTRSGWKGLVPVNFRMATDRPHIPVVQPHSPIQMGWGTGAPTRVNQPITHSQRALPPRATSVVNPDTSSATAPTRPLGRRQRQYRDVRKVPVITNHLRVHRQKTRLSV